MPKSGVRAKPARKKKEMPKTPIEILNELKDDPDFVTVDDRQWAAILAAWDHAAMHGTPATLQVMADAAGVSLATVKRWRANEAFLRASEMAQRYILFEWTPALVNKGLRLALDGDRTLLKLFLESILPTRPHAPDATPEDPSVPVFAWEPGAPPPPPPAPREPEEVPA